MVFFLRADVVFNCIQFRLAYGKDSKAGLPLKIRIAMRERFHPFGRPALYVLHDICNRTMDRLPIQNLDMILHCAHRAKRTFPFPEYSADIDPQILRVFRFYDQRAIPGGENQVRI